MKNENILIIFAITKFKKNKDNLINNVSNNKNDIDVSCYENYSRLMQIHMLVQS